MKETSFSLRISVWAAIAPIALLLVALGVTPRANAQGLGRISGIVTDATGAAVPGAHVTATQVSTGFISEAVSNGAGEYIFPSLQPTVYNIVATAPGFKTSAQNGVRLQVDQALTVNPVLNIGTVAETVTVTTEAAQVDTTTGTLSQVMDTVRVNELPLNGRNAAQLSTMVPGVLVASSSRPDRTLGKLDSARREVV
jgi:hypothetical protein